jgi:hypothetical protein
LFILNNGVQGKSFKKRNIMKRIYLIISAIILVTAGALSQNVDDALRYSQIFYGGTARFMSMGGAFTALGGDISSLSQNPAGLGVFRSSEITLTPQLMYNKTSASFNGVTEDYLYNFNLNQAGIVSNVISNNNSSGLITFNFGYSFNKTNNLYQSIIIHGKNSESSMADYWAANSKGFYKDELGDNVPDAAIAFDAWIIDTLPGSNTQYGTVYSNYGDNPPSRYGQDVTRLITYDGFTGEHAISFGGNYSNKIFFGGTFGICQLRYSSYYQHSESTDLALASKFKNFTYVDYFDNTGTGYNFKLGAIFKPVETVRIGLAFHSPTWYHINEYHYDNISSNFTDGGRYEYHNDPNRYEYGLETPFRFLAGIAFQIQKFALLSADYEYADYHSAHFYQTGDGYNYSEKNQNIKNSLKAVNNFRAGGEFRLNNVYFRAGYGYYGKAFKQGEDNEDLDYTLFSLGTGFRERNISIDFGYTHNKYSQKYFLYPLDSSYDPALAYLNSTQNMFTLTFGYRFGY